MEQQDDDFITFEMEEERAAKRRKLFNYVIAPALVVVVIVVIFAVRNAQQPTSTIMSDEYDLPVVQIDRFATGERLQLQEQIEQLRVLYDKLRNNSGLNNWRKEPMRDFHNDMQTLLQQYTAADYANASALAQTLALEMPALEQAWQDKVDDTLAQLKSAFAARDFNSSALWLERLKVLAPRHPELSDLDNQVTQLDKIVQLEASIRVAQLENNPEREAELQQRMLAFDAENIEALTRLNQIRFEAQQDKIASVVSEIQRALDIKDYINVQRLHTTLEDLAPEHEALPLFKQALDRAQSRFTLNTMLNQIQAMVQLDDWRGVKFVTDRGLTKFPSDPKLQSYAYDANMIVDSMNAMERYLRYPNRLTDMGIKAQAQRDVLRTELYIGNSESLKQKHDELVALLDVLDKTLPVQIRSDGKTDIIIRGEGQVGKVNNYIVQLLPGEYIVEGHRPGFRSTISKLSVARNPSEPLIINIKCEEPIG